MLVPVETTVIVRGERQTRTVYMRKSLTWSGHKLQGRTAFQGLNISIENRAGTYRRGIDPDGHEWKTKLHNDYGYIRGSVGVDGDHVDCFIGPDRDSQRVYIIHQVKPGTGVYDEDKVMLGFSGALEAKKAYLSNYDRSDMFGSMETVTVDQLKSLIDRRKGKKLTKSIPVMVIRKSRRNGLVPVKTVVQRSDGKTYTTTVWKRPEDGQIEMFVPRSKSSTNQTAVKRTRDTEFVPFDPPISGTGGKITGYEWAWTWGEVWSNREEGLVPARVSDWERATQSGDTNRQIVHQFHVEMPDGSTHIMGAELASRTIGIAERSLRSRSKTAYQKSQKEKDTRSKVEGLAKDAVRKWFHNTDWQESVSGLPDPGFSYHMGQHYENTLKAARREDGMVAVLPVADEMIQETIKGMSRELYGKNPAMAERFKVSGWYHSAVESELQRRGIEVFSYSAKEHRGGK